MKTYIVAVELHITADTDVEAWELAQKISRDGQLLVVSDVVTMQEISPIVELTEV